MVSLHTYPGLANGLFNMRNALLSGVPLLVINGQQDSRFLIHSPVLGAPNAQLAETATKYSLNLNWTFFNPSRGPNTNAAGESLRQQQLLFDVSARNLVLQIQQAYFNLQEQQLLIQSLFNV